MQERCRSRGTRQLDLVAPGGKNLHRLQLAINQFLAAPAILIVAGTGIYQLSEGNCDFGDLWVSGTIAILVLVALIISPSSSRPTESCCR